MANTSATGGYLTPATPPAPPVEDMALLLVFQAVVVGVTGLPGDMVRPRWQPTPPNMPSNGVSWAALGISAVRRQGFPYVEHDGTGEGRDLLQRQESVEMLCSFYGPDAAKNAGLVYDGLMGTAQNREILQLNGMGLTYVEDARAVPSLVNNQWYNRLDMPITVQREIRRAYPVLNILSATVGVTTVDPGSIEQLSSIINVQP